MNPRIARSVGVIDRYRNLLPVNEATPVITLGEGSTPLIESQKLAALVGKGCRVFLKFEGANPTGSFKDRGMTLAVSLAAQRGARTLLCASTGNTSASAAAYAARASMRCAVLLPSGKIAAGKMAQAFIYGATVIAIDGNFDACLNVVRELQQESAVAVVNSINPDRLEGQKTAAFEIVDELGDAPAAHILPVGNAGNITAYGKGYQEYRKLNRASRIPRLVGFQAAGAAPIFFDQVVASPETAASAIRIGNPASWGPAKAAIKESGGAIDIVTDDDIFEAQAWLAANEGVFAEPASAASVAGFRKWADPTRRGASRLLAELPEESNIVLTLTGHGLKDVAAVLDRCPAPLKAEANRESVLSLLA
jgi:threonine synthase